jgi:hypothetical protein
LFKSSLVLSLSGWVIYAWLVSLTRTVTLDVGVYNENYFPAERLENISRINLVSVILLFSAIIFFILSLSLKERARTLAFSVMAADSAHHFLFDQFFLSLRLNRFLAFGN